MTNNPLIVLRRPAVVVKFLWVQITFPGARISSLLKMLPADQRLTKYALRILRQQMSNNDKQAGETTFWPDGAQIKNSLLSVGTS